MRRKAFTLVEIMIVVLIIGILLAIALPNFFQSRARANARSCIANLKQIDAAKEILAQDQRLSNGATVQMSDLWPVYIRQSTQPLCPSGGTYTIGTIGQTPTCSFVDPVVPHEIP
ncbi:MAG: prepilin-type N-terminal cleavage/methylation domain-containing protein [Fimbriimonadaceae bacterium]